MSTLAEIERAIEKLPEPQVAELAQWLEERRARRVPPGAATEPDFLARAQAVWGVMPAGKPLSALVSESRE